MSSRVRVDAACRAVLHVGQHWPARCAEQRQAEVPAEVARGGRRVGQPDPTALGPEGSPNRSGAHPELLRRTRPDRPGLPVRGTHRRGRGKQRRNTGPGDHIDETSDCFSWLATGEVRGIEHKGCCGRPLRR
jgi:hypothetical protein